MSTPQQLKERWETPEGNRLKLRIVTLIEDPGWEKYLEGFPFVDEIKNGKDLRFIDLSNNNRLGRADLNETDISYANFSFSNLTEAKLNNAIAIKTNFFESTLYYAKLNRTVLKKADLNGAAMLGVEMTNAKLEEAKLIGTMLQDSNISNSEFYNNTILDGAKLYYTIAKKTIFKDSNLNAADLSNAKLSGSVFRDSILTHCNFNEADITNAEISNCSVYGISAWDLKISKNTIIKNLNISKDKSNILTINDLETAQFINLVLNNKKISKFITTMRTKAVLILGSFDDQSKPVLDKIKELLPKHNLIPIVFDFNPPIEQTSFETIKTLALLSKFVIVDLSVRSGQYLEIGIVSETIVPFATIACEGTVISGILKGFSAYDWWRGDYFSYSNDNWEEELPGLVEKEIIPWAEETNNKILKNKKR